MRKCLILLLGLFCIIPAFAAKSTSAPFSYVRIGNAADAIVAPADLGGGVVLMGGSTDVDAAFRWMCERHAGGDFLVIRATGTDAYNPYIQSLCPSANSVATLIVPSRTAANLEAVRTRIQQAEAIWIAGGDQADYINFWKGSQLSLALQARIDAGVPVGGTSAGLNVLTEFIYSALARKGVTSSQALADPYNRYMSFDRGFVAMPVLGGIIGDPHFHERDRMGRDLAFMCRIAESGWSPAPRAVSVDEQTALLIDRNAVGAVVGIGSVYFLQAPGPAEICQAATPLTYRNIAVYRIEGGAGISFDLQGWTGVGGRAYTISADRGVLSSDQADGSLY